MKYTEAVLQEFFKSLSRMVGQWRKIWFLELQWQFDHPENTSILKNRHLKGKCKDSMVNSLHKNMAYFSSVPLTVKPFVPVMIKVDWLVLHWGNAHKML